MSARWLLVAAVVLGLACSSSDDGGGNDGGTVTDIFTSPECRAFCKRLETACPDTKCDPMTDCDEMGDCLAAQRAKLACKADSKSAELTCEHPGYSLVSTCITPRNICGS
jgi:hypothetical protein